MQVWKKLNLESDRKEGTLVDEFGIMVNSWSKRRLRRPDLAISQLHPVKNVATLAAGTFIYESERRFIEILAAHENDGVMTYTCVIGSEMHLINAGKEYTFMNNGRLMLNGPHSGEKLFSVAELFDRGPTDVSLLTMKKQSVKQRHLARLSA